MTGDLERQLADLGRHVEFPPTPPLALLVQARLAADCGASEIVDINAGHNVAADQPVELAAVLDRIAEGAPG